MQREQRVTQPGGCLGYLGLLLIALVVAGVYVAERWVFVPHVGPHPALLRSGDRTQEGRIGALCWPGVNDGSDDNDPCPSWCEPAVHIRCVPEDALLVDGAVPIEFDFSRTGPPDKLTYLFYAPDDFARPVVVASAVGTGSTRASLPAVDLASGEYLLHVVAEFALGGEHQGQAATYDQGFHIIVQGD